VKIEKREGEEKITIKGAKFDRDRPIIFPRIIHFKVNYPPTKDGWASKEQSND